MQHWWDHGYYEGKDADSIDPYIQGDKCCEKREECWRSYKFEIDRGKKDGLPKTINRGE